MIKSRCKYLSVELSNDRDALSKYRNLLTAMHLPGENNFMQYRNKNICYFCKNTYVHWEGKREIELTASEVGLWCWRQWRSQRGGHGGPPNFR